MMIGYAHDHGGETYHMLDKDMGRVHVSWDVVWMWQMYFTNPRGSTAANLVISSGIDCGAEDFSAGESGGFVRDGEEGSKAEVLEGEVIEQHATHSDKLENGLVAAPGGPRTTRYGCISRQPTQLVEEVGVDTLEMPAQELSDAELTLLAALTDLAAQGDLELESKIACVAMGLRSTGISNVDELGCVGAGLGGGFNHTSELHVMKFKQAMRSTNKE